LPLIPLLGRHGTSSTSDSRPRETEINTTTTSAFASCR